MSCDMHKVIKTPIPSPMDHVYILNRSVFFVLFLLAIVLSVLLRFTDSDCPFGIFKLILEILMYHSLHKSWKETYMHPHFLK